MSEDEYVPKCPRCGGSYKIVETESKRVYLVQVICACNNLTVKFPVVKPPKLEDLKPNEAILHCMRCGKPTVHEFVRKRSKRNIFNVSPRLPKAKGPKHVFAQPMRCQECGNINPKQKEKD